LRGPKIFAATVLRLRHDVTDYWGSRVCFSVGEIT